MTRVTRFLWFLWDFIVGDDWRIALAIGVTLVVTLVLSDHGVRVWWLLPIAVVATLSLSVWTVARNRQSRR